MDYELNKKYFIGNSGTAYVVIGIIFFLIPGVIVFFSFLAFNFIIALFGAGWAALSIVFFKYAGKTNEVTDEMYDANVERYLTDIKARAINALGVDESEIAEIEPIMFSGYRFDNATSVKQGKDRLYRSDKYRCVFIMFSEYEAHVFKFTFDTRKPSYSEDTEVFFYKDIVSVSTTLESVMVLGKKFETECFKMTTAGGNCLSVSIFDKEGAQRSINAMRALLREKKQQN